MPARKPTSLVDRDRHQAAADREARASAESALTPKTALTDKPPAALTGRKVALATWARTVKLYGEIDGTIVTAFDEGILTDYCLLVEQLTELDVLRSDSLKSAEMIRRSLVTLTSKSKKKDAKTLLAEQLAIGEKLEAILDMIVKLDARIDRKRSLIHTVRQSLYLTPRSRAGVSPAERKEEIKSEMDKLLDEVIE